MAHLTEREAIFAEHDLNHQASRFCAGKASWTQLAAEIKAQTKSGELIRNGDRFTTRSAQDLERDSAARLQAGRGAHEAVMTDAQFTAALSKFEQQKGFALTAEQRAAASMILTGDDRFQGVQGLAGTGKTTMLEFVRTAAESKGWTVTGHSNGSEQAAKLQAESGIASTTTARHLIDSEQTLRGQPTSPEPPHVRELRIMDEASMAGQRQFAKVLRTTEAAGARTVFLGDRLQHQSVEAGKAFEQAQAHMPTRELGESSMRRQRTEHMKAAVKDILARRFDDAMKRIEVREVNPNQAALPPDATREQKRAAARADNAEVIKNLAGFVFAQSPEDRAKTIILTATNADRRAINSAIRSTMREHQEIAGDDVSVRTLRQSDLTPQEARRAQNYTAGQIVETSTKTQHHDKGELFEVLKTDSRTNTLRVRTRDGREQLIDPARIKIEAYDVEQSGFAAGDRVRFTKNHKIDGLAVRNGQFARIETVTDKAITLRVGSGDKAQTIQVDRSKPLKAEHAYASTSPGAQGQEDNIALVHHNVSAGRHGDRETYVNFTRARHNAVLFTQDATLAGKQAGTQLNKTAALDLTPEQPTPPTDDRKPRREKLTRASTDRAALQAQAELEQKQKKIGNATL
ncbi:multifunctional conjugation protein TraI [mine drainage metagenome]|uniref:Multifunctional conjugation protein TraI n=1 Tax=mine drainage metagenome TaxID=410659 RepID=A0A1J5S2Z3_9ZZZZ